MLTYKGATIRKRIIAVFTDIYWTAFTIVDNEEHNDYITTAPQVMNYTHCSMLNYLYHLTILGVIYIREVIGAGLAMIAKQRF